MGIAPYRFAGRLLAICQNSLLPFDERVYRNNL